MIKKSLPKYCHGKQTNLTVTMNLEYIYLTAFTHHQKILITKNTQMDFKFDNEIKLYKTYVY